MMLISVVAKEFGRLVYDATMRKLDPKWPDGMGPNTRVADAFRKVNIMPTCPEFLMRVQTMIFEAGGKVKIVGGSIDIRKFCRPAFCDESVPRDGILISCKGRLTECIVVSLNGIPTGNPVSGDSRCVHGPAHTRMERGAENGPLPIPAPHGHACLGWLHTREPIRTCDHSARACFDMLHLFLSAATGLGSSFSRPTWHQYTGILLLLYWEPGSTRGH